MKLYPKDLRRIGHTTFGPEGFTAFICHGKQYSIEAILLREILNLYGYVILEELDYEDDGDIIIHTDMPWAEYMGKFGGNKK